MGYTSTTVEGAVNFTSLVNQAKEIDGQYINKDGVTIVSNAGHGYNPEYYPVKANTGYYTNIKSTSEAPTIILYNAAKERIGVVNYPKVEFTTIKDTAYIRYNYQIYYKLDNLFLYEKPQSSTQLSDKLSVDLGVEDLRLAREANVQTGENIIPVDLILYKGTLGNVNDIPHTNPYFHSDFVPVEPYSSYASNVLDIYGATYMWFYDKEKRPIVFMHRTAGDIQFKTPGNTHFIKFSHKTTDVSGLYIIKVAASKGIVIDNLLIPAGNIIANDGAVLVKEYTAIGDSITSGWAADLSYVDLLAPQLGVKTPIKLSSNGSKVESLVVRAANIAEDYRGLITIMLGTNDITGNTSLGDADAVLAKKFDELVNASTFAESFRLGLETLLRRCPHAKVIVVLPLKVFEDDTKSERYRAIERQIASYFSIPYCETHRICGISPLTYASYMPDRVHPNNAGHGKISKALFQELKLYL